MGSNSIVFRYPLFDPIAIRLRFTFIWEVMREWAYLDEIVPDETVPANCQADRVVLRGEMFAEMMVESYGSKKEPKRFQTNSKS